MSATKSVKVLKPISYNGVRREKDTMLPMNVEDVERYASNGLVVEFDAPAPAPVKSASEGGPAGKWPLKKMTPAQYMEKFPDGPHSNLALEILALTADEDEEIDEIESPASTDEDETPLSDQPKE